jgi:hypothetical protein
LTSKPSPQSIKLLIKDLIRNVRKSSGTSSIVDGTYVHGGISQEVKVKLKKRERLEEVEHEYNIMYRLHNKNNSIGIEYSSYTKIQVDVDNVSQKLRKLKILSPITSLFDSLAQTAGEEGDLHMPVFYTENLSDVYFEYKPINRKKEITQVCLYSFLIIG